jgi:hypothetical protein
MKQRNNGKELRQNSSRYSFDSKNFTTSRGRQAEFI